MTEGQPRPIWPVPRSYVQKRRHGRRSATDRLRDGHTLDVHNHGDRAYTNSSRALIVTGLRQCRSG
jgi:hypothetical protein